MEASNTLQRLHDLQSDELRTLLELIDDLRAEGVGEYLDLPQLVVCGDQSSGKSSVLESLSGIPFPRRDTLCTRHATEVVLRRADTDQLAVSIRPSTKGHTTSYREELQDFERVLTDPKDLANLAKVFDEAEDVMGLKDKRGAFTRDVLRLELSGPAQTALTIVDLPGFIQSTTKDQSERDKQMVYDLVDDYIMNKATIIMAVVSARYDISNQCVLDRVRKIDPTGARTIGIITKPDTLASNSRSESEYLTLARNENISLGLGWHVIKNLDLEIPESRNKDRDAEEAHFFANSPFRTLAKSSRGISSLTTRLRQLQTRQIKTSLPRVIGDIKSNIQWRKAELQKLGKGRVTRDDHLQFLLRIGTRYNNICRDAVNGIYLDEFFSPDKDNKLIALVYKEYDKFSDRLHSQDLGEIAKNGPARDQAIEETKVLIRENRGIELHGLLNPYIMGPLFRQYSKNWHNVATEYITQIWDLTRRFVSDVIYSLTDMDTADAILTNWIDDKMNDLLQKSEQVLEELRIVHQRPPLSLNPNLRSDSYRRIDFDRRMAMLRAAEGPSPQGELFSGDELADLAGKLTISEKARNAETMAAEQALDAMLAYYEVALRTYIDNVPTLAVVSPILSQIAGLLSSEVLFTLDEGLLSRMAGETEEVIERRKKLEADLGKLNRGLSKCQHYCGSGRLPITPPSLANTVRQETLGFSGRSVRSTKYENASTPSPAAGNFESTTSSINDMFYDVSDDDSTPETGLKTMGFAPNFPVTPQQTPLMKNGRESSYRAARLAVSSA